MGVVIITGGSQGIGRAIAECFAREPDTSIGLVSRTVSRLQEVRRRLTALGAEAEIYPCDVTDDAQVALAASKATSDLGTPDILVNNAGHFATGSVLDTTADAFRELLAVNLTSAFVVTKAFLPAMVQRGSGHIVFIASVGSLKAYTGAAAYCAAKHGLLGLARVVREEVKSLGLRVTTILPGATMTPSWAGSGVAEARLMAAEDVAQAVVDACRLGVRAVVEEVVLRPQLGDL